MTEQTTLIIGNFDGVHLGHQTLIDRARAHAGPNGQVLALAFDPHPAAVLAPDHAPTSIESYEIRQERLRACGVDSVITLEPTKSLLSMDPDEFLDSIRAAHNPIAIVEGHDFHFGKARAGSPTSLKEWGLRNNIAIEIVGPVQVALTNQHEATASSTLTRWLLSQGRVRDAAQVLGRDHEVRGTVVQGQQLGRTIGVPTINIQSGSMLPADGVYSGFAQVNQSWVPCAINVGTRPTVSGSQRRLEAHCINTDGSCFAMPSSLPEYGWETSIRIVGWIRDQIRFDSVDTLRAQIRRDAAKAGALLGV